MKSNPILNYLYEQNQPSTADRYFRIIKHFIATNPEAKRFKYLDIINYLANLSTKYQVGTRITMLSVIKKYYNYLLETGKRKDHPCKNFKIKSKRTNIQTQNLFTHSELEELLKIKNRYSELDNRNKAALSLFLYQGISAGELIKLKLSDIDLDQGTLRIKSSSKKNGRTLEFHRTQYHLLNTYIYQCRVKLLRIKGINYTDKLFIGRTGEPISQDGIKAIFKTLKCYFPERNLSATTVRQSVITNWVNSNRLSLLAGQELAGLKYPSSAERYMKIKEEQERTLINQFHLLL